MPNTETTILTPEQVEEIEQRIDSFPLSPFQARALCATVRSAWAANQQIIGVVDGLNQRLAEVEKERNSIRDRAVELCNQRAAEWDSDDRYGRWFSAATELAQAIKELK